jgi:AbrB family looped-hinge helix DNA binding protein
MKTTVSEKGQVTIPKALRDRLGIRPGQVLEVCEDRGKLVVAKAAPTDVWESVVGILNSGRSTDEIMEELRGPVDTVDPADPE